LRTLVPAKGQPRHTKSCRALGPNFKTFKDPRIDTEESIQPASVACMVGNLSHRPARARICRSFKETRYPFSAWRAGTKPYFSYWPARLHWLAKSIPRNRFLGSINVYKYGLRLHRLGESIPGLLKRLQFQTLQ
jgi:hypothetical protein